MPVFRDLVTGVVVMLIVATALAFYIIVAFNFDITYPTELKLAALAALGWCGLKVAQDVKALRAKKGAEKRLEADREPR
jgi:hypothetical protein